MVSCDIGAVFLRYFCDNRRTKSEGRPEQYRSKAGETPEEVGRFGGRNDKEKNLCVNRMDKT
ncbi:MAG: hypothetical protein K2O69_00990 [Odoribacter sp.]|nr:hypothetical protein [Odoribacter sp.]